MKKFSNVAFSCFTLFYITFIKMDILPAFTLGSSLPPLGVGFCLRRSIRMALP